MILTFIDQLPDKEEVVRYVEQVQQSTGMKVVYLVEGTTKNLGKSIEANLYKIDEAIAKHKPETLVVCGASLSLLFTGDPINVAINKEYDYEGIRLAVNHSPVQVYNNSLLGSIFIKKFGVKILKQTTPHIITDEYDLIIETLQKVKTFSFDFETISTNPKEISALDWYRDEVLPSLLTISIQPGYSYIIPLFHKDAYKYGMIEDKIVDFLNKLFKLFYTYEMKVIAHNLFFDLGLLLKLGLDPDKIDCQLNDTMLMHHILDENSRHGLKELCSVYFPAFEGYDNAIDFNGPLEDLSKYAAIDSDLTIRLFYLFRHQLIKEELYSYYRNYTMAVSKVLIVASYQGANVDTDLIRQYIKKADEYLEDKEKQLLAFPEVQRYIKVKTDKEKKQAIEHIVQKLKVHTDKRLDKKLIKEQELLAVDKQIQAEEDPKAINKLVNKQKKIKEKIEDYEKPTIQENKYTEAITSLKLNYGLFKVNFASPAQLAEILYTKDGFNFKLPKDFKGKEIVSTNRDYLSSIDHPFIDVINAYRTIAKMKSTYYEGILEKADNNSLLHSTFKLQGTVTGRISSSDPNLQNIPQRLGFKDEQAEEILKAVKKFFVVPDDSTEIIQADYSQAELRFIANQADDLEMQQTYLNGEDLHLRTALTIHGLTLEQYKALSKEEQKEIRQTGKPANFGWVYKASIPGYIDFAYKKYGIVLDKAEAQRHKDAIFNNYKKISVWHSRQEVTVKQYGFVRTVFGRKRRLPNVYSAIPTLYEEAIRQSVNSPIQGSCGEYTLFSIAVISHLLPKQARFFNTVHDSMYFYTDKNYTSKTIEIIDSFGSNDRVMKTYFGKGVGPVQMALDFEVSNNSWADGVPVEKNIK